jgi:prepilin-type N-terminal cleavage/methylation domain-containing protein
MMFLHPYRGFTLIELMVAITVFVALLLLALPMYSEFTANSQIRNGMENTLMGGTIRGRQTQSPGRVRAESRGRLERKPDRGQFQSRKLRV